MVIDERKLAALRRTTPIPPGILMNFSQATGPLYRRVYEAIRQAILTTQLAPRTALPSTSGLARELGVSRFTVLQAYEMLIGEGYLYGVPGSGTFVAEILPEQFLFSPPADDASVEAEADPRLSSRGMKMLNFVPGPWSDPDRPSRPFDTTENPTDLFPYDTWARIGARCYRQAGRSWLRFGEAAGYRPLREALAEYLEATRGVHCTADQVVIFSGLASAVTFLAQVLTDAGDTVWVEALTDVQILAAFELAGASVVQVPTNEAGFDVQRAVRAAPGARLAFIMPSCNSPMCYTMSMASRLALLQWARDESAWVIDSDENGEFRYRGRPFPSLQGMDRHGRTFYLATFNQVLFPSLRLAYIVVPEALVKRFVYARSLYDVHSPVFEQVVLAEFIREGHFQRQVRRLREAYAKRQQVLIAAAERELSGLLEIEPRHCGTELIGWLPPGSSEPDAVEAAARHDVTVSALTLYPDRPGLVLGYADFDEAEIQAGVRRLAAALREVVP